MKKLFEDISEEIKEMFDDLIVNEYE